MRRQHAVSRCTADRETRILLREVPSLGSGVQEMKVEHAFLPKGELVLLIRVQSEEDRQELRKVFSRAFNKKGLHPVPEYAQRIAYALDASRLEFMTCKKEEKK